jgi:hypothetical protein
MSTLAAKNENTEIFENSLISEKTAPKTAINETAGFNNVVPFGYADLARNQIENHGLAKPSAIAEPLAIAEAQDIINILDRIAPNWSYAVKNMTQMGNFVTVTTAIKINGISREGIGFATVFGQKEILKAEARALKQAALKFGFVREALEKEAERSADNTIVENMEASTPPTAEPISETGFPTNPLAQTLGDQITSKQRGMIFALARELDVDAVEVCDDLMRCHISELSKRAASALIEHLQTMGKTNAPEALEAIPLRRAS